MLDSGYATYRPKDRQAKPWRRASNLTSKRVVSTVELIPDVAQRRVNITVKYREVCPTKVDAEWRGPHAAPNLIPVSINRQESQRPDGEKAYIRRFRSKNIPNIFDMIVVLVGSQYTLSYVNSELVLPTLRLTSSRSIQKEPRTKLLMERGDNAIMDSRILRSTGQRGPITYKSRALLARAEIAVASTTGMKIGMCSGCGAGVRGGLERKVIRDSSSGWGSSAHADQYPGIVCIKGDSEGGATEVGSSLSCVSIRENFEEAGGDDKQGSCYWRDRLVLERGQGALQVVSEGEGNCLIYRFEPRPLESSGHPESPLPTCYARVQDCVEMPSSEASSTLPASQLELLPTIEDMVLVEPGAGQPSQGSLLNTVQTPTTPVKIQSRVSRRHDESVLAAHLEEENAYGAFERWKHMRSEALERYRAQRREPGWKKWYAQWETNELGEGIPGIDKAFRDDPRYWKYVIEEAGWFLE